MDARRATAIFLFALLTTASFLQAAVISGRWEKVQALKEGYAVAVKLESGEEIKASYAGLTEEGLVLRRISGEKLEIPKSAVLTVTSQEKVTNDGLGNGAIIGAGVGLGVVLAMLAAASSGEGYVLSSAQWAGPLLGIGLGLGAGLAVDASLKGKETFYQGHPRSSQ